MVRRPECITIGEATGLVECQAAGRHDRPSAVFPLDQEDKIDAAVGGGPFNMDVLPDCTSRHSLICDPEGIDEAMFILPFGEGRGFLSHIHITYPGELGTDGHSISGAGYVTEQPTIEQKHDKNYNQTPVHSAEHGY
jgi:hypothetical protein